MWFKHGISNDSMIESTCWLVRNQYVLEMLDFNVVDKFLFPITSSYPLCFVEDMKPFISSSVWSHSSNVAGGVKHRVTPIQCPLSQSTSQPPEESLYMK